MSADIVARPSHGCVQDEDVPRNKRGVEASELAIAPDGLCEDQVWGVRPEVQNALRPTFQQRASFEIGAIMCETECRAWRQLGDCPLHDCGQRGLSTAKDDKFLRPALDVRSINPAPLLQNGNI